MDYGHRFKDLTNQKFGRLSVIKRISPIGVKKIKWLCKCDCGNEIEVYATYLQNGDTKSCGCLKKELEEKHLRDEYDNKRVDGVAMHLFNDKPRKDSSTGYRGVSKYYTRKSKQLRYRAWITVKGKRYYKSGFKTPEEAYYKGRLELERKYLPQERTDENEHRRN